MARYNATYTSVWDGGVYVSARCYAPKKAEMIKGRRVHAITRMGKNDYPGDDGELEILEQEFITLDNGKIYSALSEDGLYDIENVYQPGEDIYTY